MGVICTNPDRPELHADHNMVYAGLAMGLSMGGVILFLEWRNLKQWWRNRE